MSDDEIREIKPDTDSDEYEKVCYVCRRPESKAGKMITMPPGIDICFDCMQNAFNSIQNSGLDMGMMSGITPEMLWNAGMPNGMWQMPPSQKKTKKSETPVEAGEEKAAEKVAASKDADTETIGEEDVEVIDEDSEEEDEQAMGQGGIPLGNMGWGIPIGQIDLSALTGKKRVKKKKNKKSSDAKIPSYHSPRK